MSTDIGEVLHMTKRKLDRYEIGLLLTFLLTGLAGLFLPQQTSSNTLLTMPTELLYVWQAVSAIGGALGLVGTALSRRGPKRWMLGKVLLRSGLSLVGLQLTGFGLAVLGLFNWKALFVATILLSFAWAAWGHIWDIGRDINTFRKAITAQMEGGDGLESRPPGSERSRRRDRPDRAGLHSLADPENESRDRQDDS